MAEKKQTAYSTEQIEKYFSHAFALAQEAFAHDEIPVGAIVVYQGEVIAAQRNRVVERRDPLAHAELLAIQESSRVLKNERLLGCELFTTLEPCLMCSGAISLARLDFVHFLAKDEKLPSFTDVMNFNNLNHYSGFGYYPNLYDASALLSEFFKLRRQKSQKKSK